MGAAGRYTFWFVARYATTVCYRPAGEGPGVPVRLSVNDAGQRYGRSGVCLGGWLEEGAGVPVRLSADDASQRDGRGMSACCVKARPCRYDYR